jgi:hypothetical protein
MAISGVLSRRIERDAKSPDYWYVPKRQAVSPPLGVLFYDSAA